MHNFPLSCILSPIRLMVSKLSLPSGSAFVFWSTPQTGQLRQQMFTVSRISCYRSKIKVLAVLSVSSEGWEGVWSVSLALCLVIAGILWHSTAYRHIPEISAFICTWISSCVLACVSKTFLKKNIQWIEAHPNELILT